MTNPQALQHESEASLASAAASEPVSKEKRIVGHIARPFLPFLLCIYGLSLGLPTIIKAFGVSDATAGLLSVALTMAASAAVGIATFNSLATPGGYLGPNGIGLIKDATGSLAAGLDFLAATLVFAVLVTFAVRAALRTPPAHAGGLASES